ncbi:M20/M25/M40 family metallo-hydrolase [Sphingobacterium sp. lm-10]|uniref:M20/M25/M40 family metallo-hydrolase n=1 Tax=Sphingobacterium sp. lm-10 TaxID=2944904 RepID=UPI0020222B76|nr:M20/M25/M40 family metallo-hydrolase [Sphingobacterium sp. lm-10]MCL7988267.1 M20/M25/M40 family metallo-hydrolase [Sphingobacterium sp. lm-10]
MIHPFFSIKKLSLAFGLVLSSLTLSAQVAEKAYLERILNTLASDEMRGRHALTPDIERAADFIAQEFKEIGLKPYAEENFRQTFHLNRISAAGQSVMVDGAALSPEQFLIFGRPGELQWDHNKAIKTSSIAEGDDFSQAFRAHALQGQEDEIIWVHPAHQALLTRFKKMIGEESLIPVTPNAKQAPTKFFVIQDAAPQNFQFTAKSNQQEIPLFNVVGLLPGKSKPEEYVILSAHYDHIGIIDAVGQDSIANGADDDASGTTAVIALAKHFKALDNNERTLLFVAFTAEEIGMYGSKHFGNNIDPDKVVAMINIEMIGKDSKFGPNTLYITGFEASNLGQLVQEKVKGSAFTFHPDPYPQQNLFYRSDNATLAALGVPAHTFSTSQIDKDEYYHTVKDEVSTLDIENIRASIEAIAHGITGIVSGEQTPTRVEKLRE